MSEIDSIEDLCDSVESLPETTSSLERAWKSIPKCMHAPSQPFIIDNYFDPMLQLPHDKVCTMDAVSKCWKTIMPNSDSLLLQETDGITWAICEECVSQIPKEIYSALNFFHKLQAHIQDYAMYAVPMENITLKRDRKRPKIITNIVWTRCERQQEQPSSFLGHQLDLSSILTERMSYGKSVNEVVPAIKIRLAFTGASYTFNNTEEKKTFAVLLVTFARNFDALNYIKEVFLKPSHLNKNVPPADMILAWKRMIRFVAFDNLGLDETRLHKPENYSDDPCGALGVDTLMNLFQIPLQIFGAIYNSHRQSPYEVIAIENLRVSGFPEISFGHNEMTKDYVEYMKAHIDTISKYREQLERALLKYNAPKKKKDEDMEETETDLVFDLVCTGAWPLEESLDIFSKWGMPKMPIFLDFQPEFTPDMQTPFSHWVVEAGGPNGIPELIKTCLRFYMVSVHDNERICWDHFLSNKEFANPSLVLQKYYSEKADPLSALIMPGYLREWWANFTADIRLETDMPTIAEKFHRYLKSVMLNHKSTVECNTYRSERILQAIHIIKKLDFASISYTGPNCIKDMIVETSANMSRNRQHDIYQVRIYTRFTFSFW